MRIAFDVSPLSHPLLGIGNYMRGSLGGLAEASEGRHEIVAFAPTSIQGPRRIRAALGGMDVEVRTWPLPFSHAVRTAWSAVGHPAAERLLGDFDVLHFSDWMYPPQRSGVRATTIHDLVPIHHPEWTTARTRSMHTRKYGNAAATCDVVLVNSAYTGRDVTATLGVPSERIHVARPAPKSVFHADGPAADLGAPYVLTVATLEPRKNLRVLVEAHRLLGGVPQLAVVGAEGWGEQPLLDAPGIHRLGYVSDDELARLYRGAAVVAYPSRFEGFGIPVIEAMACGVPVVVVVARVARRGERRCCRARGPGGSSSASRRRSSRRSAIASAWSPRACNTSDVLVARGRRDVPARLRGGVAMRGDQEIVVVVRRQGELLVMRRAPERLGYWSLVAGGLEPDESPREAAQRELLEETALQAEVRQLPIALSYSLLDDPPAIRARYSPGIERVTVHAFVTDAPDGWEPTLDAEHDLYRWCALERGVELMAYETARDALRAGAAAP